VACRTSFYRDSRHLYRHAELDRLPWLEYGFGTRSSGHWVDGSLVTARQMHSDVCLWLDQPPARPPAADALITSTPGLLVGVRTADCVPILIVDERLRAVAAVHAGWRGSALGVAARAVAALSARLSSRPEDLLAALGPAICGRCYQVGPEVAQRFSPWFPELSAASRPVRLDLVEVNRRQLIQAGLAAVRVYSGAPCTSCQPQEFYSHRRGSGESGRMLSAVGIRLE